MLLSGICWSVVYIELIHSGLKYKTYVMPLFALGLNFAWEVIYSIDELVLGAASLQGWVNLVWATLDAIIVYTYFKYGQKYYTDEVQKYFIPFSILAFITCFAMQFAFYFQFDTVTASQYSAFAQNAAMSIMFLVMLFQRKDTEGQTILMAVAKWIGTFVPTILGGFLESINIYIIIMGGICFIFDALYTIFLKKKKINNRSNEYI